MKTELPRRVSMLMIGSAVLALLMTAAGVLAWLHLDEAAAAYPRVLLAPGEKGEDVPRQIGLALRYDVAAAAVLTAVAVYLARALRKPFPWVRAATWAVVGVAWVVLACGLAAPPEQPAWRDENVPVPVDQARADLLAGWYPSVHSILVFATLAVLTTVAVFLLREPAREFYRKTSGATATDWSAFGPDRG